MDREWGCQAGSWKDGNSALGQRLEDFLMRNPEWVLYVRKDIRFKCPTHWNPATESQSYADPVCDWCYGFGMKVSFEIVPCRIARGGRGFGGNGGEELDVGGFIPMDPVICDFPRHIRAKTEDVILTCEWKQRASELSAGGKFKPARFSSTYLIKEINPHFEREIVLFNTALELYAIEDRKMTTLLARLGTVKVNLPSKEEWQQGYSW